MERYDGMGRSTTVARWGSLALVTLLLLVSVLTSGSSVVAAGPGPVFSNLQASSTDVESGGTVFLAVHLTSSADIISNPAISFLFPDGTPGPSVLFNHVGGSLRDGDWQATLELSVYLPDGTYDVNDLRAVDAAGNLTVYNPEDEAANNPTAMVKSKLQAINVTSAPSSDPLEQVGTSAPKSASLSVTNPATTTTDIRAVNATTMLTSNSQNSLPPECNSAHPKGPFFRELSFDKGAYRLGDVVKVTSRILDCDTGHYDFAGAEIVLRIVCDDERTIVTGPHGTWVRLHDPDGTNYQYESRLHLPKQINCKPLAIIINYVRAWDGQGNNNRFSSNSPPDLMIPSYNPPRLTS